MTTNGPVDDNDDRKKRLEETQKEIENIKNGDRFEMPDEMRDTGRMLRKLPGVRRFLNFMVYGIIMPPTLIMKGQGKLLFNPEMRKLMFDRETKTGMLEDAIFAPMLWCPNDDGTSLQYDKALAGRYAVYDFNRREEFGKKALPRGKGRLIAFPLEEIIGNDINEYTPSTLVDPVDLGQLLQLVVSPKIEELVGWGLIRETNYIEAYVRVGLYDKYKLAIDMKNLGNETVYQITPKGNGLVNIMLDGGEKTPEKKKAMELVPGWYGGSI
jgi:hypothetical protein